MYIRFTINKYKMRKILPLILFLLISINLFSDNAIKIYSSEIQEYRTVDSGIKSDSFSRYLAIDKNGLQCYLYLGKDEDGDIYTIIEYSDYAWLYYLKPNN